MKESLLDEVSARLTSRRGLPLGSWSESPASEESDFGGDSDVGTATRSYGFRVRRIGPVLSRRPLLIAWGFGLVSCIFFGRVRAQLSHTLSLLSYVFKKFESAL